MHVEVAMEVDAVEEMTMVQSLTSNIFNTSFPIWIIAPLGKSLRTTQPEKLNNKLQMSLTLTQSSNSLSLAMIIKINYLFMYLNQFYDYVS